MEKSYGDGKVAFLTLEEDAFTIDMRKAGSTFLQIAKATGRISGSIGTRWRSYLDESNAAVRPEKQARGSRPHMFNAEDEKQLKQMVSLGNSTFEMAMALEVSRSSIYGRLEVLRSRAPIQKNPKEPWSEIERQRLRSVVEGSIHACEIEQLFPNRSLGALERMCRRLELPVAKGFFYGKERWSPADDAELLRLKAAGISFATIGASVGRTVRSCINRHIRLREAATQKASG